MTSNPLRTAFIAIACSFAAQLPANDLAWPATDSETKPWSRWWWQGSAVNEADIERLLKIYSDAGLGGLEITPIYGVRGQEENFLDFLSPAFMEKLVFTLEKAEQLGLGIDLANGTGWPFGGPMVSPEQSSRYLASKTYELNGGEHLKDPIAYQQETVLRTVSKSSLQIEDLVDPIADNENLQELAIDQVRFPKPLPLLCLMAYSDSGQTLDLSNRVSENGTLDWLAPEGRWTLYAVFMGWHGKLVERAAPGGEGYVIDHFDSEAIRSYLETFDHAFDGHDLSYLRAFFNDSYEVDDALGQSDWTPAFFDEFEKRRGYDLREQLPALFGKDNLDTNARVVGDYRQTLSDLLLETFTTEWATWAHKRNAIIRNQAHGSPANILDLYAASSIPETESIEPLRVKWGASAGSVSGKELIAAEAATWLDEHFKPSLNDVRQTLDHFFLNGVNHIVYHGTNYSPSDVKWPGWLFYAATHFNERNSWWVDFPALNLYATRVQSFLQQGKPDRDVLLYFPAYADFAETGHDWLKHYGESNQKIEGSNFLALYHQLNRNGFTHDFVSDLQLQHTSFRDNTLRTEGNRYQTILIPETRFIEDETFDKLLELANDGATVIFHRSLPQKIAGLADYASKESNFQSLKASLKFASSPRGQIAPHGKGHIVLTASIAPALEASGAPRETLVESGLDFTRRRTEHGIIYFLANRSDSDYRGWIPLAKAKTSVALFEPMSASVGYTETRKSSSGSIEAYLEIPKGTSIIALSSDSPASENRYTFFQPSGETVDVSGQWSLSFLTGGPTLPETQQTDRPHFWSDFTADDYRNFSGTAAYAISFRKPKGKAKHWQLDLGDVRQSATVFLNGKKLGTLIGPHYQVTLPKKALKRNNQLEIRVSNRMGNRIASLDREGLSWKNHYNINFPARLGSNRGEDDLFTAADWPVEDSGLNGPVTLTPLEAKTDF